MKIILNSYRITDVLNVTLVCLLLLSSCAKKEESKAINTDDAIAYVYPMDVVTIDGNLADWPEDMLRYRIKNAELGDKPIGKADFDGNFRIGFNAMENSVYIGMEVLDQSVVMDTSNTSNWNTQDGLELYLNQENLWPGSPVTQYSEYGENRQAFGEKDTWENVEMKKQTTETGSMVEWKINLNQKIETGMSMGLDLVVIDKDEDDSFTWISWAPGTQKVANPDRCGNVLFVTPETEFGQLKGKADLSGLKPKSFPFTMRVSQVDNEKMWVRTNIDSLGNFSATLPVGEYQIDFPSKLMQVDHRFQRISPIDPIVFSLKVSGNDMLPAIAPKSMPKPYEIPEKGLLHDFGKEQRKQVDEYVESYRKFYTIPGVSLALIKDGKIAYHKTYGVKNSNTKEPVTKNTLFEAASVTKPVFAYVVLRLADRGIIDLDKPLYTYLPFEGLAGYPEYKMMTGRHVLVHRSGLPNWGWEMIHTPGEKYGYSGEGFEYLKRVIVKITGKKIEQILDEELIKPYGLYPMEFSDSEALQKVVSSGHIGNQPTDWGIPQEAGMAFSMHTEAKAFSRFALTLLERKGLKPNTYKDFFTIQTQSNKEYWNNPNKVEGPGLGIFIRETDYGNTFYHGGNNGDFKCLFEVYDDLKMGYVVYTNSDTGSELTIDLWQLLVEGKKEIE